MKTFKDENCGILIALVHLLEVDDLQIFILNKHKIMEYVSLLVDPSNRTPVIILKCILHYMN